MTTMDYEVFKKHILELVGLDLSCYKEKQMLRRINSLISKNNYPGYSEYLNAIRKDTQLYDEFINFLTINVSEFYRNPEQWKILESEIIPMVLERNKTPKIWSSACSTGDEPYTLVMVLSKILPIDKIKIIATDIDLGAIEKAKAGVYSKKSIENLPQEYLRNFFEENNGFYKISDKVKKCVEFKQLNLLKDNYPDNCDLILCRNVLIYFTEEAKTFIYEKFNKALKLNANLFIGSTEQIIQYSRYGLKPLKTFFYLKDSEIKI